MHSSYTFIEKIFSPFPVITSWAIESIWIFIFSIILLSSKTIRDAPSLSFKIKLNICTWYELSIFASNEKWGFKVFIINKLEILKKYSNIIA